MKKGQAFLPVLIETFFASYHAAIHIAAGEAVLKALVDHFLHRIHQQCFLVVIKLQ